MSRPLDVVVVSGSPSQRSKTAALADLITARLGVLVPITVRRVELYRLGPGFSGALSREDVPADIEAQLRAVEQADVIVDHAHLNLPRPTH